MNHMTADIEYRILMALNRAENEKAEVKNLSNISFEEQYSGFIEFSVETEIGQIRLNVFNDCDEFDYIQEITWNNQTWHFPLPEYNKPMMTRSITEWKPKYVTKERWAGAEW